MDMVLDSAALDRRPATHTALAVLEAAIEQALGFPVQVRQLQLWVSPSVFEEGNVPETFIRLRLPDPMLDAHLWRLLGGPTPWQDVPSAKEMGRRRKALPKA